MSPAAPVHHPKLKSTVLKGTTKKTPSAFYAQIRSRHPTHNSLRRNPKLRFSERVVVRFGSTTTLDKINNKDDRKYIELNTVEAIKNCSNKLLMKQLFASNGIQSPKFFTVDEIKKVKVNFPLIKKIQFRSRGNGMEFIKDQKELDECLSRIGSRKDVYFEEYFNGSREYRFHVTRNGCFYTCRKMRKEGAKDRWYFNSRNCVWIIDTNTAYNKPTTFDDIVKECVKALDALKMDFCAFDVRVKKDGSFMIIEGNSAPSFGEITLQKYEEIIPQLVKNKMKQ